MARTKVDNKLNVVIGTKAQIEGDADIPENSIIVVTDEELKADEIAYSAEKNVKEAIDEKQDELIAGDNITIVGNTISASGGGGGGGLTALTVTSPNDYTFNIASEGYNEVIICVSTKWLLEGEIEMGSIRVTRTLIGSNYIGEKVWAREFGGGDGKGGLNISGNKNSISVYEYNPEDKMWAMVKPTVTAYGR